VSAGFALKMVLDTQSSLVFGCGIRQVMLGHLLENGVEVAVRISDIQPYHRHGHLNLSYQWPFSA
jgi:hypothetical protein